MHFNKIPHTLGEFSFQCIYQVQAHNSEEIERLLITKEAYWSAQLFSLTPHDLNKRMEFYSRSFIPKTEFVIINFLCYSLRSCMGIRSKALFVDFVSLLDAE